MANAVGSDTLDMHVKGKSNKFLFNLYLGLVESVHIHSKYLSFSFFFWKIGGAKASLNGTQMNQKKFDSMHII